MLSSKKSNIANFEGRASGWVEGALGMGGMSEGWGQTVGSAGSSAFASTSACNAT